MTTAVPMHPEATSDPQELRWIVPTGTLTVAGAMAALPGDLTELLTAGLLDSVRVEPPAIVLRLSEGSTWAKEGPRVRDALAAALQEPGGWIACCQTSDDEALLAALTDVIDGPAGDFVRSHGGEVSIISVGDDCAKVHMGGSCAHCPALGFTLGMRLESEIRKRYPALRSLTADTRPAPSKLGRRRGVLQRMSAGE